MFTVGDSDRPVAGTVTRREFLQAGGAGVLGLSLGAWVEAAPASAAPAPKRCILLFLCGAPSHIDTWDPKPNAPAEVRGPFRAIATNVPGTHLCEHFPRMARRADKFTLVRSMYHHEAPIHETGHQLMQTGRLFGAGVEFPTYGSVVAQVRGRQGALPPYVVVPQPLGNTGVSVPHGQEAGCLGPEYDPFYWDPDRSAAQPRGVGLLRAAPVNGVVGAPLDPQVADALDVVKEDARLQEAYGPTAFGRNCLLARRMIERGVHAVTVNMFDTVFNAVTWDCHANGGDLATTLDDYKKTVCPMFDRAYTALLDDLAARGLLEDTLVVAMGEFGRTYKVNSRGGRDHWPGVWTIVLAGGGIAGGQVVGASDRHGAEPKDRPVHPSELAASIYSILGIDPALRLRGPQGRSLPLVEAEPVGELFAGSRLRRRMTMG